jgi:hypothetical protein
MKVIDMSGETKKTRQKKRTVGIVAIVLLLVFTVLALAQVIDWFVWVIADLIVAAVANLLLRKLGSRPL